MANDVRIRATVNDQVSGPLGRIKDKFDTLGKSGGFKSIVQGVGMGVGIAAWNQIGNAIGAATQLIGDATRAALEEEASIAKLDAALRANVASYDGNTAAIEETLSARMRLGFADDEQRDSLARLVSVTKDSTKALALQRTAMDLARLRGMDLATASDLVGKVFGGNIGILSRYGIQLKKGTTATQALAEIQKRAAGQAEAYADTNAGKLLASQIKVGEAMEKLGAVALPAVVEGTELAADAIEDLSGALDGLSFSLPVIDSSLIDIAANIKGVADAGTTPLMHLSGLFEVAADAVDALGISTDNARGIFRDFGFDVEDGADHSMDAVESMRGDIGDELGKTSDHFDGFAENADDATERVAKSFDDMVDALRGDAQSLIDDFFDPIETRADIYQSREEQRAAEERLRDAKTAAAKREATDDIIGAISDQADSLVDLSERGKLTSRDIDNFEKNVKKSYDVLGKEVPADIARIIAKLRELDKWDGHVINVYTKYTTTTGTGSDGRRGHRATGGPVKADEAYIVGESGRELFVPNEDGHIIPNSRIDSGIGPLGLSSQPVIVFNFNGLTYPPSPAQQQEMARTLGPALRDYLNRRG